MVHQIQLYLFGDQTYDNNAKLRCLLLSNSDPFLIAFFERAFQALRAEIGQLPLREREGFPRFSSFIDLLVRQREAGLNAAFEKALACIYQFGYFINQHSEGGRSYPLPSETYLLGLCTGTLAAAAVSCCKSLSELLPVAVQTVLVAFRAGRCALDVRNRIEPSTEFMTSWSMVIPGISATAASEALEEFVQVNHLPRTSRPYISAYAQGNLTISGPPGILVNLRRSPALVKSSVLEIPVHAPYHAPHLFNRFDVESILETTSAEIWASYKVNIPVVSSATGTLIWAEDFKSLLHAALTEVLIEPIRWDAIGECVTSVLQSIGESKLKLISVATTAEHALCSVLKPVKQPSDESAGSLPLTYPLPNLPIEIDYQQMVTSPSMEATPSGRPEKSKIAIIGMSGRFPDAENPSAFWDLLYNGRDVHKVVPPNRWDVKTHVDITGKKKNTSATPYGCWLDNPGMFDARFFNMSPREAPQVDPAQRLALLTAYEAIEQAGIVPDASPSTQKDRVGVFYGVTSNDWMETNSAQDIDTYFIPGGNRAFIPGRINYFFKFSGPSYSVDTACSSSLAAMHVACNSLWRGDIDTAIAGGTNVLTNPDFTAGLDRGHFLSRTGNCKTFDDDADGYCRGEGVGTVILKRLEDALADNDPIQGLILGAYTNHSAEAESITRPHVGAQRAIFEKILNVVGMDPYDISYVEMHGTGTQAGDAGEMQSVLDTFAPSTACQKRRSDQVLHLGSVKANIGHGEAASGISGLAKILLMMQKNLIPPHCGIKTQINQKFPTDLKERNVHIATEPTPWTQNKGNARKVFLNNFSAAGGNTALLLEDAPASIRDNVPDPRTSHIVAISAKCAASLRGNLQSLLGFIGATNEQELSLPGLSYTTTARRMHHPHRVIVSGSDLQAIRMRLEEAIARDDGMTRAKSAPKITFTFTGQGSQYPGMGKQLYEASPHFRSNICRFDQLCQSQGFPSIQPLYHADGDDIGDYTPLVVQLAGVCLQMALARLWASWGIIPNAVVGHSLGEYAALNVAGVLSDSDTIYLVGKRAQLIQQRCNRGTHSMLAVKASPATISSLLTGQIYEVACMNSPDETVLSGRSDNIHAILTLLNAHKLRTTVLKVPYAFHSSQVDPILEDFEVASRGATFHEPLVPVICPLLGKVVTKADTFGPHYLVRHCREPVNMVDALLTAKQTNIITDKTFIVEIGSHPVVSGMVKATIGPLTTLPTLRRDKDTWIVLTEGLSRFYSAGIEISWTEYHRDFKSSHQVLQLPAYSWDLKDYWMQYENDWSLRKGDPLPVIGSQIGTSALESTTVHRLVEESAEGCKIALVVESDISRPDLNPLVQGHKVDQIPLCTPSVYADITLTLGTYLLDRFRPEMKERVIDICDMVVEKALIAKDQSPQLVRSSVEVNWTTKSATCQFYSVDGKGQTTEEHAHCSIRFMAKPQSRELELKVVDVRSRINELRTGIGSGRTQRFNKSMVYKMVSSLAQFNPEYRGIDEIILDSNAFEACSRVSFGGVKKGGSFNTHPAYIDSLSQTGGFVMNANDGADLDVEVFVNHGWKSFQLFQEISPEKSYETYVQMKECEGKTWEGDVVVLDGDSVAAIFKGIILLGVSRRVLHYVLTLASKPKSQIQQPNGILPATTTNLAAAELVSDVSSCIDSKPAKSHLIAPALHIISDESGVAVADLTDDSVFSDIGVDSLLSLVIASRFREELFLEMALESMFTDFPTVKHLKGFLGGGLSDEIDSAASAQITDVALKSMLLSDEESGSDSSSNGQTTRTKSTSPTLSEDSCSEQDIAVKEPPNSIRPATSILLQGLLTNAQKTLFLFPDGCGSASSYVGLPWLNGEICVVGLNSPYIRTPQDMKCTVDELVGSYLREVRRRQPSGPYHFGGWSAGGILAYRAAQQLINNGVEVRSLILVDSPVPKGLDRLPQHFYDYCNSIGLFGQIAGTPGAAPPTWLIPHFNATIDVLHDYYAEPLLRGRTPKTSIIWASESVMDGRNIPKLPAHPEDTEGMKFLTEKRTDFSANGWQDLIPGGEITVTTAAGAHHFSMMQGSYAAQLVNIIDQAMR